MEGLPPEFSRLIESCGIYALTINEYLNAMRKEITLSISYKKITIKSLAYLSKFLSNKNLKKCNHRT